MPSTDIDEARLRAQLSKICGDARAPGLVVSVQTPTRRFDLAVGSHDLAGRDALDATASFELGCVVKPLLAIATLRLAAQGLLRVDDPIGRHLPELAGVAHGRQVRVAHLLSHTSGYRGTGMLEGRGLGWPALVDFLARAPRLFPPGLVFSYEHSETALLGRLLVTRSGRELDELLTALVLAPCAIAAPGAASAGRHAVDRGGRLEPVAGPPAGSSFWQPGFSIALSMPDLIRVGAALLGQGRNARGNRGALLAALREGEVALPAMIAGPACPELPVGFVRGMAVFRGGWLGANGMGAGQCTAFRLHPASGVAVALGINVMAPGFRDTLVSALCRDLVPAAVPMPGPVVPPLDAFAGEYVGGGDGWIRAAYAAGVLELEIGARCAPGRLRARLSARGGGVHLEADVPHLAVGLAAAPEHGRSLMLGLSAFKRVRVSARSREI